MQTSIIAAAVLAEAEVLSAQMPDGHRHRNAAGMHACTDASDVSWPNHAADVGIATEAPDMASAHRPADMRAAAESADMAATAKAAASARLRRSGQ
jgi:hypothetical protein